MYIHIHYYFFLSPDDSKALLIRCRTPAPNKKAMITTNILPLNKNRPSTTPSAIIDSSCFLVCGL